MIWDLNFIEFNSSHSKIINQKITTFGGYAISKSGLDMLTKSSAIELGPKNIRVNCVKWANSALFIYIIIYEIFFQ